jgi:transcriptional regulator
MATDKADFIKILPAVGSRTVAIAGKTAKPENIEKTYVPPQIVGHPKAFVAVEILYGKKFVHLAKIIFNRAIISKIKHFYEK